MRCCCLLLPAAAAAGATAAAAALLLLLLANAQLMEVMQCCWKLRHMCARTSGIWARAYVQIYMQVLCLTGRFPH